MGKLKTENLAIVVQFHSWALKSQRQNWFDN